MQKVEVPDHGQYWTSMGILILWVLDVFYSVFIILNFVITRNTTLEKQYMCTFCFISAN